MIGALHSYFAAILGDLRRTLGRAEGQAMLEFAVIVSLVSMVTLGTIAMAGTSVRDVLGNISGSVSVTQAGTTTTTQAPAKAKKKKKGG